MQKKIILLLLLFISCRLYSQVTLITSNLPIVVINTNGETIPDEPKITADMFIVYNGNGNRNHINGPYNHYDGKIGIELRGSSSQNFDKKSYAVETRDELGEDLNVSLFDMPEESDWVLHGPYSDKSLMRNMLIYELSNEIGKYASRSKLVEVVINGKYLGVYVWMEKIKRDKNRVDVKKLTEIDISGDELTGGYIFKIDKKAGDNTEGWFSFFSPYEGATAQIFYQYHYPKGEDMEPVQRAYIQGFVWEFETLMSSPNFNQPFDGYYDFIDLNTFVDFFLLNELSKNVDGYRLSTYLYKDKDSENPLLKMGPIWDFNLAFGNANYYDGSNTSGFQVLFGQTENQKNDLFQISFWWKKIFEDPVFQNNIAVRWNELRTTVFSNTNLLAMINSIASEVDEAKDRNFTKWPILDTLIWPNSFVGGSYEAEIDYLSGWVDERTAWLDNAISSDYSRIEWADTSSFEVLLNNGETKIISLDEVLYNYQNVDSITFESNSEFVSVSNTVNDLTVYVSGEGNFYIKGIAWKNDAKVDLSPAYLVSTIKTDVEDELHVNKFNLNQNYPNPFNPTTIINYELKALGHVKLMVYNILGKEVAELVNEKQYSGRYKIEFNGAVLPSGVYFYRLIAGNFVDTKSMVLIK